MLNAAIDSGQWWWLATVIAGGLLAAVYVFRVLNLAFTNGTEATPLPAVSLLPGLLPLSAFALALITVLLGFNALWVLEVLDIGVPPLQAVPGGEVL